MILTYLFYLNNPKITNNGFRSNVNCFCPESLVFLTMFVMQRNMIAAFFVVSVAAVASAVWCLLVVEVVFILGRYKCELVRT